MSRAQILFVIDSLGIGGGEKSLVSLLSVIDYSKFDVDLLIFRRGGEFEQFMSPNVKIIAPPASLSAVLRPSMHQLFLKGKLKSLYQRIKFSMSVRLMRKDRTVRRKNQLFWSCFARFIELQPKEYDVAIGYSQGVPTYYVVDKVRAKKKFAWINVFYNLTRQQRKFQERFYRALDKIVLVSEASHDNFKTIYPHLTERMTVIHDICNANLPYKMAEQEAAEMDTGNTKLLTVARLDYHFKGLDITAKACEELVKRGVNFKWYFVGDGKDRDYLETYISEHNLQNYLILLGSKANPYPYFKACDIYVQTSRQEGWGISLVEARLFNKPVVTTEFSTVWDQMVQGKNGIVTDFEPQHVAGAIEKLIYDKELYESIQNYQMTEQKGNEEEVEKLYSIIDV